MCVILSKTTTTKLSLPNQKPTTTTLLLASVKTQNKALLNPWVQNLTAKHLLFQPVLSKKRCTENVIASSHCFCSLALAVLALFRHPPLPARSLELLPPPPPPPLHTCLRHLESSMAEQLGRPPDRLPMVDWWRLDWLTSTAREATEEPLWLAGQSALQASPSGYQLLGLMWSGEERQGVGLLFSVTCLTSSNPNHILELNSLQVMMTSYVIC